MAILVAWALVAGFNAVSVPWMLTDRDPRDFVTTGAVLGLLLPVAVACCFLDEGDATLVAVAGRRLAPVRLLVGVGYLACCLLLGVVAIWALPLASGILVADLVLLTGLTLIGVACLGFELGWTVAAAVVLLASVPGLVPPVHNWIYRVDRVELVLTLGVAACVTGLGAYAAGGCGGILRRAAGHST